MGDHELYLMSDVIHLYCWQQYKCLLADVFENFLKAYNLHPVTSIQVLDWTGLDWQIV
jgi:hypothetical protein